MDPRNLHKTAWPTTLSLTSFDDIMCDESAIKTDKNNIKTVKLNETLERIIFTG